MKYGLILILLGLTPAVFAAGGHNEMRGFKFVTCEGETCVELTAPSALVSSLRGGFTARGGAHLHVLDRAGRLKTSYDGETATYSPDLGTITVEKSETTFAIFSLKDSTLTPYNPHQQAKTP